MPIVLGPLLVGFAIIVGALVLYGIHETGTTVWRSLFGSLGGKGGFFDTLYHTPVVGGLLHAINHAVRGTRHAISHALAIRLAPLTKWLGSVGSLVLMIEQTASVLADDTLHALSYLRHHTIPALISKAVTPVAHLAHVAERDARRSISLVHKAERDFTRGIDRLGHRLEAFTMRQVHGIDRLIREHVLPRLRVVERDVAVTIPHELARVNARLKRIEKLLGLGVIAGVVYKVLARVAPWIFCRNVKKLGNTVCGMNTNELNTLLQLLVGAFVIADLRQLTRFALEIEEETAKEVKDLLGV